MKNKVILISGLIIIILIAFLMFLNPTIESTTFQPPTETEITNYALLGSPDAPVTFIEFSDYQCPFCRKFTTETFPKIKEDYIDTGKVKFTFKDFPLAIHKNARISAVSAICAGEQNKYFEYHDILFENNREISEQNLQLWAEELGLNMNEFNICTSNPEKAAIVEANFQEGKSLGVTGTPTFFINGNKIVGAQPYAAFKQIIDKELKILPLAFELSSDSECNSDSDCPEPKTFPGYCSSTGANEACTTTSLQTCKLPGTTDSTCVTIIEENCSPCPDRTFCTDGKCI